ncbi:MAG: ERF family protein [Bacillota bacterium]
MGEKTESNKSIYEKISNARQEINEADIPKSGYSKFGNYEYHELADFLPFITKACNNNRITPIFNLNRDEKGKENAELTIHDWDSTKIIKYNSPVDSFSNKKMKPIQELGAKHTFMRRYLYMDAFDISEKSIPELLQGSESKKTKVDKKIDKKVQEKKKQKKKNNDYKKVSPVQLKAIAKSRNMSVEDIIKMYNEKFDKKVNSLKDISDKERAKLFIKIKNK